QRWALVAYVKTLSPQYENPPPQPLAIPDKLPPAPDLLELGAGIYTKTCANCHGSDALGNPAMAGQPFPGLRFGRNGGGEMLSGNSEDDLARTLMTGFHTRSPMLSFRAYFYGSDEPNAAELKDGQ